ncbi:MAG: hypothetical protein NTY01_05540 [Verrucomicrobia bacterium]|nr:hypothetical protein [Verrucomicrobiota bacterium]
MGNKQPTPATNERQPAVAAELESIVLLAGIRDDSKLKPLLQDPATGLDLLRLIIYGTKKEVAAWLESHGVKIATSNLYSGCDSIVDAVKDLMAERATLALYREQAAKEGKQLEEIYMEGGAAGIAKMMRAAKASDPEQAAKLMLEGTGKLVDVVNAKTKIAAAAQKKEEFELALQKYKDAAKRAVDTALDEFADVLKKFPKLRAQYVEFRAAVNTALQEAA